MVPTPSRSRGNSVDLAIAMARDQHVHIVLSPARDRRKKVLAVPERQDDRHVGFAAFVDIGRLEHEARGRADEAQIFGGRSHRSSPWPSRCRPMRRNARMRCLSAGGAGLFRVEQAVHVNDEIAHLGVVDGALRLGLPRRISAGIVRIDADDVELVEILELGLRHAVELAAKDKMKQLLSRFGDV